MSLRRLTIWAALPAVALVLFGARWFRREARGAADFPPIVKKSAFDTWSGTRTAGEPAEGKLRGWWVFGWDGADWDLLLPLLEDGRLPHLASLIRQGTAGNLYTIKPTLSPVLWTTMATGMAPHEHGILDFVRRPDGMNKALRRLTDDERRRLQFYSNGDRRVRALWNLMSERKRPVLVVGYHNTYPAERVTGVMVSNYLIRKHALEAFGRDVESLGALASPGALVPHLARFQRAVGSLKWEEMRRFADLSREEFDERMARVDTDKKPSGERWLYLSKAYLHDQFHAEVAYDLLPRIDPDLMMVHFQSIDWASHEFLQFHPAARRATTVSPNPGGYRRYDRTVTAFYEYADEWLGKFLARRPPDIGVAVVSDHGFEIVLDDEGRGQHGEGPPGILVLSGPGVRRGSRVQGATIYDVFPTLAAGAGLPISRQLRGRVLAEAFAAQSMDKAERVASYETDTHYVPDVALSDALQSELASELKALGYIN